MANSERGVATRFKPGDDPRRDKFGEGNAAAMTHGLSTRMVDPMKRIAEPFRIYIPQDATLDMLEENLAPLIDAATLVHDTLSAAPNVGTLRAQGKYSQMITKMSTTLIQIQGGQLAPEHAGAATKEQVDALKRQFAHTLSGDLTKIKYAYHYIELQGDVLDEDYAVFSWVEQGLLAVLVSSRNTIEKWARLLLWEERKQGHTNRMIEAYAKTAQKR